MSATLLLGFLTPDQLGVMIPIVALTIPIVAVLSKHQQRMTEIIRGQHNSTLENDVAAMKQELAYLRGLVQNQTLALEAMRSKQVAEEAADPLAQRLS
jgi:hypothetical protein